MLYDVIIIGGGAAGLTAGIFTSRKKLKTLIITVDVGGQNLLTQVEENYPGYLDKSGPKLMSLFEQQAKSFGVKFIFGKVKTAKKKADNFVLTLANGESYETRSVIIASGKIPRTLGIPGEEEFMGRGVLNCVNFDPSGFKKKKVAVIGGGNCAVEAAEILAKFASNVYLVHRRDAFRADEITVEKLKTIKNVELVLDSVPVQIAGTSAVNALSVENVKSKKKRSIDVNNVFIEIGYIVDTDFAKELVKINEEKEIVVNSIGETSCPGIFAAGDVTNIPYKQTVVSAGMGAVAGLSAYNYLMKLEGKAGAKIDWSKAG